MCYSVYIGTNLELETSEWDKDNRDVYVEAVVSGPESGVKRHLSKKNIYYIGSSQGCGCGFQATEPPFYTVEETRAFQESQKNVGRFCRLLEEILERSRECEVFLCWDYEYGQDLQHRDEVTVEYFKYGGWVEDKPTLYVVRKRGALSNS